MEIQEVIAQARAGKHLPVHVLVGPERFLIERAVALLRKAALGDSPSGFNDDTFHGQGLSAQRVSQAASTLPMLSKMRFLLVRDADAMADAELEGLNAYLRAPSPSTCLVLTAEKIDGRGRFAKLSKDSGFWTESPVLRGPQMRSFAAAEAKSRGHAFDGDALDALIDAAGSELGALDDALERLSLYAGVGQRITLEAVDACIAKVRVESIWSLVDAVGMRDAKTALRTAGSLLGDREPPLKILALVSRQLRMVAKMRDALASGLNPAEAAKAAGAPPFKARELSESARRFTPADLRACFRTLAATDQALKGSKVPGDVVLEQALLTLCRAR